MTISHSRYSNFAIILHWLLAFALAFQIGLGWRLEQLSLGQGLFDATQLHKSIGISILILSALRILLRLFKKPPPFLSDDRWARLLSKVTHYALYLFMIGAPLSGWLLVSTSELDIDTYLFGVLYWPHVPGTEYLTLAVRDIINGLSYSAHEYLAWMGVALFFLHIVGALRHQIWKGEAILVRILPIEKLGGKYAGGLAITILIACIIATYLIAQYSDISIAAVGQRAAPTSDMIKLDDDIKAQIIIADDPLNSETKAVGSEKNAASILQEIEEDKAAADPVSKPEIKSPFRWNIIGQKTLTFSVQWNDDVVTGKFTDWNADILFSVDAIEKSSVAVNINLSSVATSDSTVDGAIGGVDFFNISSSSSASFRSDKIISMGGGKYQMPGQLRLKNITRPMTIMFTLQIDGDNAKVTGSGVINRLAHDIGKTNYPEIANRVTIEFDFKATRQN